MEKIGSIIGRVVGGEAQAGSVQPVRDNGDIDCLWFKVVDEKMRAHSYVDGFRRGILYVRVDSSCYLAEMKIKKRGILSSLHTAGWENVRDIEFRM